jgi:hypothetical protein
MDARHCDGPPHIPDTAQSEVLPQFESTDLFGFAGGGSVELEPGVAAAEGAVAGEIWDGRQVAAGNVGSLLHPMRIVWNALPNLRPRACETSGPGLP